MKLEPSKLVSKELKVSFISLVYFGVGIYPVVLPYEASENLKWELGHRFALNAEIQYFRYVFSAFLSEIPTL